MGSGSWTTNAFNAYTTSTKGVDAVTFATANNVTVQDVYKAHNLSAALNPKNVMRECRDSEEHPNTVPVILALDVTGSMGQAAVKVAQKLNDIMTEIYTNKSVPDIEFCIMGIGDLKYDDAPIQISQFESDIRIAEQLDEIYFEGGGGGNKYESYTAAWYMGLHHCDLDCWKRGKKGIIITMGDERLNPMLPKLDWSGHKGLGGVTGDAVQADIETTELFEEAKEKFELYHLSVDDKDSSYKWINANYDIDGSWHELLGDHYDVVTLDSLAKKITSIITDNIGVTKYEANPNINPNGEIGW